MKNRPQFPRPLSTRLSLAAAVTVAALSWAAPSHATDGIWTNVGGGPWSTATNWNASAIADGAGSIANFSTINLVSSNRTVTIDTTPRTVGTLLLGDSSSSDNRSYIIAASGGATLTFDNNGSNAVLTQTGASNGDIISAPILLNDSLDITNTRNGKTLTLSSGGITAGTAGLKTISILGTATGAVTLSGVIGDGAGSIAIVKGNANNTLALTAANTFSGGVTMNAGTLVLNNSGSGGTSSAIGTGTLTITGGTIGSTSGSSVTLSTNNAQNWNGDFTFDGTQSLNLGTGAVTMSGNRTVTIGSTNDTFTVGGVISGVGFSLSTENLGTAISGILGLSGANTYDGGTNINGGVLRFNNGSAIPTTGMITIQSGGALSVSGARTTLSTWLNDSHLSTASTGALSLAGDKTENFNPGATGHDMISLGANVGTTATYTGTYTPGSAGYLAGGGGGTIRFTNANAFTGAENLTVGRGGGGTVVLGESNDFTGVTTIVNGTLQIGDGGTTGAIDSTSAVVNNATLTFKQTDDVTFDRNVSGSGDLRQSGTGRLVLSGSNSYGGTTYIDSGTLEFASTTAVAGGAMVIGQGSTAGTFDASNLSPTIDSLRFESTSAGATNIVTIGSGQTLTVTGTGSLKLGVAGTTNVQTNATFNGGGALVVDNTSGSIEVGFETSPSNSTPANVSVLDLSALGSFTANVNELRVGYGSKNDSTLLLSDTANTITANTVQISNSINSNADPGHLILGAGTNVFHATTFNIGTSKGDGTLDFASQTSGSPGTVVITNKSGTGGANMIIGSTEGTGTAAILFGTLDLRGHEAQVNAATIRLGRRNDTLAGTATGYLYFDTGTFNATTIYAGDRSSTGNSDATGNIYVSGGSFTVGTLAMASKSSTSTGSAIGNVEVSGGTFTVNTAFTLASNTGSGSAVGTFTITGGTVVSNADILDGGGTTTSTLTLDGGTLDLTGHNLGDGVNAIDTLNFQSGRLANVADINGGAAFEKTGTGTLYLAGSNTFTGATTVSGGILNVVDSTALQNSAGVTVATGGAFNFVTGSGGSLTLAPTTGTALSLADGSSVGAELGSTTGSIVIQSGAVASTAASAGIAINVLGRAGLTHPGTSTIVSAADGGLTSNGATYSLGTVYNNSDFTVTTSDITATDTAIQIATHAAATLPTAYWKGGFSGGNNVWAASNGSTLSNWATDLAGTDTGVVPGSATDVIFSVTAGASQQGNMVLGTSMEIHSLTVSDTSAVTLNSAFNTLTIGGDSAITIDAAAGATTLDAAIAFTGTPTVFVDNSGGLSLGTITSGAGFTKSGSGALTILRGGDFGGNLAVLDGSLRLVGSNNGIGGLVLGDVSTDGTLILGDSTGSVDITVNSLGTMSGNAANKVVGGSPGISTLTVTNSGSNQFSGTLGGGGTYENDLALVKTGAGALTLNRANTYLGSTTISEGTIILGTNDTLPSTTALTLGTGTTTGNLDLGNFDQTVASFSVLTNSATANTVTIGVGHTMTINGDIFVGVDVSTSAVTKVTFTGGGALVVNDQGGSIQIGGATGGTNQNTATVDLRNLASFTADLGDTGLLRIGDNTGSYIEGNGASTLRLATDNTITTGTLSIGADNGTNVAETLALGSGTNLMNADTLYVGGQAIGARGRGYLKFDGASGTLTLRAADGVSRASLQMVTGGSTTGYTITGDADFTDHDVDVLLNELTMSSRSNGSASGSAITNFSFDTGTLDITAVTLSNKTAQGSPNGTSSATLNIGGGIANLGSVQLAGSTAPSGGTQTTTGTLNMTGGVVTLGGDITKIGGTATTAVVNLNGATLDMDGHNIGSGTQSIDTLTLASGTLQDVGEINGGGAISKTTAGTLTMAGTNAYSGATNIDAGTLLVAGSQTGTGLVTVANGAALGGSGSIAGAVTVQSGGTLAPGSSPSYLSTGSVDLQSGAYLELELGPTNPGSGYDVLNVTGSVLLAGEAQIVLFAGFANQLNDKFFVIINDGSDTVSGAFSNAPGGTIDVGDGRIFTVNYADNAPFLAGGDNGDNDVSFTLTAVPEPGSWVSLLGSLGMLAGLQRIRRRQR